MPDESFPHLPLQREEPVTEKRPGGRRIPATPADPAGHGRALRQRLDTAKAEAATDVGGFDDRPLFRFAVEKGFDPDALLNISNDIEIVSQEGDDVVVAFVSTAALESFEARLASLAGGERVQYKEVLYALEGIDGWSADDRTGWALRQEGLPADSPFALDVELWPLEDKPGERTRLWQAFEHWLADEGMVVVDSVKHEGLSLYRVRCDHGQAERLLHHRDIRTVDLPPKYGLELALVYTDIQDLPATEAPPDNAPGLVVLDSGLTTGHPLLAPAVGDAESFLPGKGPEDEHGHGTLVAGLALFGDLESALRDGNLAPRLRLFSGRILDENNQNETGFVENQISEAVRYFNGEYGCRIFNLSFGDRNKPYLGKHVKGLSYTLDVLSRELNVLFVVSAGNVSGAQLDGDAWRNRYPDYLTEADWAIVEPAPSINSLTVGSLARYDQTTNSQRYSGDPAEIPIARRGQPSPFSRHGHSVGGAIKPELVAFGGNWAVNTRAGANMLVPNSGLGELSTYSGFVMGRLFADESGTSMAAPHVAHLAAGLLAEYPDADTNLIRALLVAHAEIPDASMELFADKDALRQVCGYGQASVDALYRSLENSVTLVATERIANKRHHFYEIFVPDDFVSSGRRAREITVAMAHTPFVRSTRIAYKATRMDFRVVAAQDIVHAAAVFNRATDRDEYERIAELPRANVGPQARDKGTVQASTWRFTQFNNRSTLRNKRLFVVVTRNDFPWGEPHGAAEEPYALVVCLRDHENEEARLYTELRNRLQARARARART